MSIYGCRTLAELAVAWNVDDREVYTHGLEALARRLPFFHRFKMSSVWRQFVTRVNLWRPSWRYDPVDHRADEAKAFLDAVADVYRWLDGVDS